MSVAFCVQVALDTNTASVVNYYGASRQMDATASITYRKTKMTLEKWMRKKKLTDLEMANLIECSRSAITMYRLGQRIPRPQLAKRIAEVTKGSVTPNDFYA